MIDNSIVRLPTGVKGLDSLIEGGFIKGDSILVAGHPGTGKTTMSLQFIYQGAKIGEQGAYISLLEPVWKIKRNALRFGWNFEELEKKNMVKFVDLIPVLESRDVPGLLSAALNSVENFKPKRLVIDTLSALLSAVKDPGEGRILLSMINHFLSKIRCTTLLLSEIPWGERRLGMGIEEFIADALIILEIYIEKNRLWRRLCIAKMRGTKHSLDYYNIYISDKGVEISPIPATRL